MEQLDLLPIELEGVSQERPLIIAGPCSAETEEQVMTTAKSLSDKVSRYSVPESGNPAPNREVSKVSVWKVFPG